MITDESGYTSGFEATPPSQQMVGADHVDKARAWDAEQASFRKGYERGKAEAAALLAAIEADPDRTTAWPTDKAKLAWKKDVFEPALATLRSSLPSPQTRRDAFEVGDEVVCIDNSYPCGSLVIGQTYKVRHVGMTAIGCDSIGLVGIGNPGRADWHASRFRLAPPPQTNLVGPADQIISQIEELFPNWRAYRDLVDCITCELHELRQRAEGKSNG